MTALIVGFPGSESIATALSERLSGEHRTLAWRHFPDGESLVTLDATCQDRDVIFVCSMIEPDRLALPLLFAARTAREFGARRIGLVAPYLAYMRQDKRFHAGEAISAPHFAAFLSWVVDWLVTVDPHLHRNPTLQPLFGIPAQHVSAMPAAADWIATNVSRPILIGPDSESVQWVATVASRIGAPMTVLQKNRRGDRDVEVSLPDRDLLQGRTPVLIDDIIASGHTLIETLGHLKRLGLPPAVCVAVHGIFADNADTLVLAAGASRLATSNTIAHASNAFDITAVLLPAVTAMLRQAAERSVA
ncbi:ribose-phosphate diphosphokinase [Tahibacter amnicola]|uniref:Ribose-phosphate diphosphokinase n=1 Tax=Tahibacter amnicola TaxID=2976241 RepID=A0ABY6BCK3_9GAMM|nr:ribose-phosphate diphosphokinase [Tahibacter amnicola]UXI66055.1 ribose-phosphate diphosphokinase [Tahibacter amnicola]